MIKLLKELIESIKGKAKKKEYEWDSFQGIAKIQFLKLKDKGLGIPVITL